MMQCLQESPDQTALELLIEFKARYPERYSLRQLSTLKRRVKMWRRQAIQRLIGELTSNILREANVTTLREGNTTQHARHQLRPHFL